MPETPVKQVVASAAVPVVVLPVEEHPEEPSTPVDLEPEEPSTPVEVAPGWEPSTPVEAALEEPATLVVAEEPLHPVEEGIEEPATPVEVAVEEPVTDEVVFVEVAKAGPVTPAPSVPVAASPAQSATDTLVGLVFEQRREIKELRAANEKLCAALLEFENPVKGQIASDIFVGKQATQRILAESSRAEASVSLHTDSVKVLSLAEFNKARADNAEENRDRKRPKRVDFLCTVCPSLPELPGEHEAAKHFASAKHLRWAKEQVKANELNRIAKARRLHREQQ